MDAKADLSRRLAHNLCELVPFAGHWFNQHLILRSRQSIVEKMAV